MGHGDTDSGSSGQSRTGEYREFCMGPQIVRHLDTDIGAWRHPF